MLASSVGAKSPLGIRKPSPPSLFLLPPSQYSIDLEYHSDDDDDIAGRICFSEIPKCKTCEPVKPMCIKLTMDEYDYSYHIVHVDKCKHKQDIVH